MSLAGLIVTADQLRREVLHIDGFEGGTEEPLAWGHWLDLFLSDTGILLLFTAHKPKIEDRKQQRLVITRM